MTPMPFRWTGEAFEPLPRFRPQADRELVVGQVYMLDERQERSPATHNHEFAWLAEAWQNLPEHLGERFATAEHLRKFALIKAGYHDSQTFVASSKAEALRLAAFLRPIDEFSVVTVSGATVTRFIAKSQSRRAMDKATFQDSKQKVLEIVAEMIGVSPDALSSHARGIAA